MNMNPNMNQEEMRCSTPPEILEIAAKMTNGLLPDKSKNFYMKAYSKFKDWCRAKNVTLVSENILLAYFHDYSHEKKASTLWAHYSMLKSTISLKENVDISKFFKLIAFLKRKNTNYLPKKASTFTQEEITKFLTEASDECYISMKVALVIGLAGACRTDELCNMLIADVNIKDDMIIISIPTSKNESSRKFVVMENFWMEIIKKYLKMRPTPDLPKVFINIRNGKATRQHIGHNTIGQMPKKIALYLKLQNPESYTGHSFRRSSATILALGGGDIIQLKQLGGWKSSSVAEGYVEDSLAAKKNIARMLQGLPTSSFIDIPVSTPNPSIVPIPSTSALQSPIMKETDSCSNSTINIPRSNLTHSLNMNGPGINMTCHNCTVNYDFNK